MDLVLITIGYVYFRGAKTTQTPLNCMSGKWPWAWFPNPGSRNPWVSTVGIRRRILNQSGMIRCPFSQKLNLVRSEKSVYIFAVLINAIVIKKRDPNWPPFCFNWQIEWSVCSGNWPRLLARGGVRSYGGQLLLPTFAWFHLWAGTPAFQEW